MQEGKPLSMIDNWEKLHKNGEYWINDVARKKHASPIAIHN